LTEAFHVAPWEERSASARSLGGAPLREITPLVVPNLADLRDPEDRELLLSGRRLAMGEAT
jgi:hypothetical protein